MCIPCRSYLIKTDYVEPLKNLDEFMETEKKLMTTKFHIEFHHNLYADYSRRLTEQGRNVKVDGKSNKQSNQAINFFIYRKYKFLSNL